MAVNQVGTVPVTVTVALVAPLATVAEVDCTGETALHVGREITVGERVGHGDGEALAGGARGTTRRTGPELPDTVRVLVPRAWSR